MDAKNELNFVTRTDPSLINNLFIVVIDGCADAGMQGVQFTQTSNTISD